MIQPDPVTFSQNSTRSRPLLNAMRRYTRTSPWGRRASRSTLLFALGCGVVILLQGLAPQSPWIDRILGAAWLLGSAGFAFYAEQRDWAVPSPSAWLPWLKSSS